MSLFNKFLLSFSFFSFIIFAHVTQASLQNAHAQVSSSGIPSDFVFSRTLKVGDAVWPDVNYLQYVLDQDEKTIVASSGLGSMNQTTQIFGSKTQDAVIRFQELYAQEILTPSGLNQGNGFVGPRTLAKLNSILAKKTVTKATSSPIVNKKIATNGTREQKDAFIPIFENEILIYGLSHIKVRPGDTVNAVGFGYSSSTVLHIGEDSTYPLNLISDSEFSFRVPALPYDSYNVWVTDSTSSSKGRSPVNIIIGTITDTRPNILSVTPIQTKTDGTITVVADNLNRYGNTIYSSLGIIKNVSSLDGKTLTFKVADLPKTQAFLANKKIDQFGVSFSIGTAGTRTINYGRFTLIK